MDSDEMLSILDVATVERLKTAVEIGKWPKGIAWTAEQRQTCRQAVSAWEHQKTPEKERTGDIEKGHKEEGEECDSHVPEPEFKPIRFI